MKRKSLITVVVALVTTFSISNSYGGWGTETWHKSIVIVPCSYSGVSSIAVGGSYGPGQISFSGGAAESGTVVYAHYAGETKDCNGYRGRCSGQGLQRVTSYQPIQPCPDRS